MWNIIKLNTQVYDVRAISAGTCRDLCEAQFAYLSKNDMPATGGIHNL